MPEHYIEYWPLDKVVAVAQNEKGHDVTVITKSMERFGYTNSCTIDERTGKLHAGHGRLETLQGMRERGESPPDGVTEDWTLPVERGWASANDQEATAARISDNQSGIVGGWLDDKLFESLNSLDDLDGIGFTLEDLNALAAKVSELPPTPATDPDHVPQTPKTARSKRGDVFILGAHRVMCGDSTDVDDVLTLMGETQGVELMHADPPYGMGKEADGVANDNLYRDKLDKFQMEWWRAWRPYLAENASAYIWGNAEDLWRLWYCGGLVDSERLTLRNEIVWNKGFAQQFAQAENGNAVLRSFNVTTERCLFFMLGEQGFNNNADNYWEGWEPIRSYLDGERERAGWTPDDVKRVTGVGMFSHWFTKSQWAFITAEHYEKLQAAGSGEYLKRDYEDLKRDYEDLKRDYEDLKRDFYSTRAHFDNTHDNMTDVWDFPRVTGADRQGHATPKPVAMVERVIRSSCPVGGTVIEPFGGSGTTLMAAQAAGATSLTMELLPIWVDVICKRFQESTGVIPSLESTGEPFDFCAETASTTSTP